MKTVYPAILDNGKLTWLSAVPNTLGPVRVEVEISDETETTGKHPVRFLEQIAQSGGVASLVDPARWEREERGDRPLPGRAP